MLKYTAITMGGAFGVLALMVEYRDKYGRLTKWGSVAVIGVLVTAAISIVSQAIESFEAEASARRAASAAADNMRESRLALSQMERLLQPIQGLHLTIVWDLPPTLPGDNALVAKLSEFRRLLLANSTSLNESANGERMLYHNKPLAFVFNANAPLLLPSLRSSPALTSVFTATGASVTACATAADALALRQRIESDGIHEPSLGRYGDSCDLGFDIFSDTQKTTYRIADQRLAVKLDEQIDIISTRNNGRIVSIPDLENSTIFFEAEFGSKPVNSGQRRILESYRHLLRLSYVAISASGRDYLFGPSDIHAAFAGATATYFMIGPVVGGRLN